MNRIERLRIASHQATKHVAQLTGYATALPKFSVTQAETCEFAQQVGLTSRSPRVLETLYRQSGVKQRYSVLLERADGPLVERQSFFHIRAANDPVETFRGPTTKTRMLAYKQYAAPLAIEAASNALKISDVDASQVTHLITVSCSGFASPGVDIALIEQLELQPDVRRTHVGFMGCHASLNALRIAKALCDSGNEACVLVCSIELCTLHQQYTDDPQQIVANSLFSDGAAAAVIQSKFTGSDGTTVDDQDWIIADTASMVLPSTREMMSWHVGDHGFEMGLSPQVPAIIEKHLKPWLYDWLSQHDLDFDDIEQWVVHPGGPRILDAVESSLELSSDSLVASRRVLERCGNMSSPTIFFVLDEAMKSSNANHAVMLAFGPGLVAEAVLLSARSTMND
jgi:predicted naringenin-chalcone synthase